jgi:hypothetical protein
VSEDLNGAHQDNEKPISVIINVIYYLHQDKNREDSM